MGKKVKIGKSRKDKFYHLAKETGYRSRAAFKLLQLNRKYNFLEKSRICIDLCAAPGGWLQVAANHMPISSLIVGVDLVPIKPIHNVASFQEDITTEKCRQTLKRELQTWKADVVLHDGAPNVGKNWLHDAYQQAELTLQALKLASVFLKKGGWFITKVFRSKDYHALMWVFSQLFKRVFATKPQASRNESAEIFVVCQWYKAPDALDAKFTDPKHVFKEVHLDEKTQLNLIHPEKHTRHREGYDENDTAFYHKLPVGTFLTADNHLELLASTNQILLNDPAVADHVLTTPEIKACCKDIKVLGKKELRSIIAWRKRMRDALEEEKNRKEREAEEKDKSEDDDDEDEDLEEEEAKVNEEISRLNEEQQKDAKKKRKKVMKEKRKLRDKMALKMVHPGDVIEETDDISLFDLKKMKTKKELTNVRKRDTMDDDDEDEEEDVEQAIFEQKAMMSYDRHGNKPDYLLDGDSEEENDVEEELSGDDEEDMQDSDEEGLADDAAVEEEEDNPLVTDLESKDGRIKNKMAMWYSKDAFAGLENEADEDLEIEKMTQEHKRKGGVILEKCSAKKTKKQKTDSEDSGHVSDSDLEENSTARRGSKRRSPETGIKMDESDEDDDSDADSVGDGDLKFDVDDIDDDDTDGDDSGSDYDVDESLHRTLVQQQRGDKMAQKEAKKKDVKNKPNKDGFEIVAAENQLPQKVLKLDPVELAIGEELIKSSKRRREIIEMSYNRYTRGEEDLPDWFAKEESRHCRKQLPVTKEQIGRYKEKQKAIDVRPIKKIAQAKARKKRKMTKKLERARKKAEAMSDNAEMSDREKWKNIKDIYKKAGLLRKQKKEVAYVVAKKGGGRKATRPDGVKGRYRVVDPRMKKDNMMRKQKEKNEKKKRKGKSKGGRK